MTRWLVWMSFAIFFASPAMAQNNCAQFKILGTTGDADYNPFNPQQLAKTFALRVTRIDKKVTTVRFLLVDTTPAAGGLGLGAGGPALYDVQWLEQPGRQVLVPGTNAINSTNAVTVTFGGSASDVAIAQMQLLVPRGQAAQPGRHTENLAVRYQCLTDASGAAFESEQATADTSIDVTVPRYAAAYVGSVGNVHGTIAFGMLAPHSGNVERGISITALSTVPYDVKIESDHGGRLVRSDATDTPNISYQMRYAGVPVRSGATVTCPSTMPPATSTSEFRVMLDGAALASAPAGDYHDVVAITLTPRDGNIATTCQVRPGNQ